MSGGVEPSTAAPSALHRYCGGLMEACWLSAVVAVPLLYNPHARDGFEPFKTVFLRLFAIVLAAAWAVRAAEGRPLGRFLTAVRRSRLRQFVAAVVVLFCVSLAISTVLSVYPWRSFLGSYEQRQGSLTESCCILIFAAIAAELRSGAQLRRLLTALIVPTLPISLYAIMQRLGFDSLQIPLSEDGRVPGLAGNPIYLAAYLGMVLPFTFLRLRDAACGSWAGRRVKIAGIAFYAAVGLLQFSAFLMTKSRGPLLGLVAGLSFLAVAHAALASRRRVKGVLAVAALAILALAVLGHYSGPSPAEPGQVTILKRLSAAMPGVVSADEGRIELWRQAASLVTSTRPVIFPSGEADRWHALRPLVGFGPETLDCVLPLRLYTGDVVPDVWTRFHNQFWDRWYAMGLAGALLFLGLTAFSFGAAYRRLGWIRSRADWRKFGALVILTTAILSFGLVAHFGPGFAGLAAMVGPAMGFAAYAALRGLCLPPSGEPIGPPGFRREFLLASLAAIVVHLVETGFAFEVVPTELLFWVCLGIAAGMPVGSPEQDCEAANLPVSGNKNSEGSRVGAAVAGATLVAVLLAFAFVSVVSFDPLSVGAILSASLSSMGVGGGPSHLMAAILVPSWLGAAFAFTLDEAGSAGDLPWQAAFFLAAMASGIFGTALAVAKAGQLAAASSFLQAWRFEASSLGLVVVCLVVVGFWALWLRSECNATRCHMTRREGRAGIVVLAGLAPALWIACTNPLRANTLAGLARQLNAAGRLPSAIDAYERALGVDRDANGYRFELAEMLVARAQTSGSKDAFKEGMGAAEALLKEGRKISTLDQGAIVLGDIYEQWAAGEDNPAEKRAIALKARRSLEEALAFKPWEELALADIAAVDEIFLQDPAGSAAALKRADGLVFDDEAGEWFDFYSQLSLATRSPELAQFLARRAFWCCDKAVEHAGRVAKPVFSLYLRRGVFHFQRKEFRAAATSFQQAANEDHDPDAWKAEAYLGQTYQALGERESSLTHIDRAIALGPESVQAGLQSLRARAGAP